MAARAVPLLNTESTVYENNNNKKAITPSSTLPGANRTRHMPLLRSAGVPPCFAPVREARDPTYDGTSRAILYKSEGAKRHAPHLPNAPSISKGALDTSPVRSTRSTSTTETTCSQSPHGRVQATRSPYGEGAALSAPLASRNSTGSWPEGGVQGMSTQREQLWTVDMAARGEEATLQALASNSGQ